MLYGSQTRGVPPYLSSQHVWRTHHSVQWSYCSIVVCSHCTWCSWCSWCFWHRNHLFTYTPLPLIICFPNIHLTHIITLVTSGCIRNYQKMVSSGEFSLTQPWRLCTPPLRVSPTLWRVIWRRVGLGVTPWTQQSHLHMLRLGSDNYVIDVRLHLRHFLSVIVSAHHVHLTPPSCVTWSSPGQRWRSSQPEHWGAQWWWVVRTHTGISFIISERFFGNSIRLLCASQNAIAGYLELVSSERVSFQTSEGTVV